MYNHVFLVRMGCVYASDDPLSEVFTTDGAIGLFFLADHQHADSLRTDVRMSWRQSDVNYLGTESFSGCGYGYTDAHERRHM